MGGRIRPRFELTTDESAQDVMDRMARRLMSKSCPLCGVVAQYRIELHVPPERQHLWSPELRVELEEGESETRLLGTYGPHPHVWTLYVGIYAGIVFAIFVTSVFAYAQWVMQAPMVALYVLPPLVLLGLAAHGLAFVGQGLGAGQADELRSFLEGVLSQEPAEDAPAQSGVRATTPTVRAS